MSNLADLTAAGDSTSLPGYILSPLTLADYGELERAFESRHLARAAAAAGMLAPEAAALTVQKSLDDVRSGLFTFGMPSFDREALKWQNLPYLLWLELRERHREATPEMAVRLFKEAPDKDVLRRAVQTLAGYRFDSKKKDEAGTGSTGPSSSEPSAATGSGATQPSPG